MSKPATPVRSPAEEMGATMEDGIHAIPPVKPKEGIFSDLTKEEFNVAAEKAKQNATTEKKA